MELAMKWVAYGGLAVLAVLALKMVMALFGMVFGVVGFILFTVLPILLIGWIVVKLYQALSKKSTRGSAA